jgi:sugar lactone lactonase YvrE
VTTLAGSAAGFLDSLSGSSAQFDAPTSLAVDGGGSVYVADQNNHRIRKITAGGVVTTVAGSGVAGSSEGTGIAAEFDSPDGVVVASDGTLYVADTGNNRIRRILSDGRVDTIAGSTTGLVDGPRSTAKFAAPYGIALDESLVTDVLYVADVNNHRIRRVEIPPPPPPVGGPTGVVVTLAGSGTASSLDGTGTAASFSSPNVGVLDRDGNFIVSDFYAGIVRRVNPAGVVTTVASGFNTPYGLGIDSGGNIYVGECGAHRIRKIEAGTGAVSLFAGTGATGPLTGPRLDSAFACPADLRFDSLGNLFFLDFTNSQILKIDTVGNLSLFAGSTPGYQEGTGDVAQFNNPFGLAIDSSNNLFVTDVLNNAIRKVSASGVVSTLVAPGVFNGAPRKITIDSLNNLYVNDESSIRKISPAGVVSLVAGSLTTQGYVDGPAADARFSAPWGLAINSAGVIYVTDTANHRIRVINPAGYVSPLTFTSSPLVGIATADSGFAGHTFTASPGTPAPAFTIVAGGLPLGLTLNSAIGILSGTPTTVGAHRFIVRASNGGASPSVDQVGSITVAPAAGSTTVVFDSNSSWSAFTATPLGTTPATSVGAAQSLCLDPLVQPCMPGQIDISLPYGILTADVSSIPAAEWLWLPGVSNTTAAVDVDAWFQKTINIPGVPTGGSIKVSVDDGSQIYVNGTLIGSADRFRLRR